MYAAAQLAYFLARPHAALEHGTASLAVADVLGFENRAVDALLMMAYSADDAGRADDALCLYEQSVERSRRLGDRARLSYALNGLGGRWMEAKPEAGIALFEESLLLAREAGDDDSVAITLQNLARCLLRCGRCPEAAAALREALAIARRIDAARATIYVLEACAALAAADGQGDRAARYLGCADAQWQRIKVDRPIGERPEAERTEAQARAQLGSGSFVAQHAEGLALGLDPAVTEIDAWLGNRA